MVQLIMHVWYRSSSFPQDHVWYAQSGGLKLVSLGRDWRSQQFDLCLPHFCTHVGQGLWYVNKTPRMGLSYIIS